MPVTGRLLLDSLLSLFSIKSHCIQDHLIIDLDPAMKEVADVVPDELSHDGPESPLLCLGPSVKAVYNVLVADFLLFFFLFPMMCFGGGTGGRRCRGRRQFNLILKLDQLFHRFLTRGCESPLRLIYLSS